MGLIDHGSPPLVICMYFVMYAEKEFERNLHEKWFRKLYLKLGVASLLLLNLLLSVLTADIVVDPGPSGADVDRSLVSHCAAWLEGRSVVSLGESIHRLLH